MQTETRQSRINANTTLEDLTDAELLELTVEEQHHLAEPVAFVSPSVFARLREFGWVDARLVKGAAVNIRDAVPLYAHPSTPPEAKEHEMVAIVDDGPPLLSRVRDALNRAEAQEPERKVTSRKSRRGPQYRCAECSRGFMPKGPMIQHLMGSAHGMERGAAEVALEYAQPCAVPPVSAADSVHTICPVCENQSAKPLGDGRFRCDNCNAEWTEATS